MKEKIIEYMENMLWKSGSSHDIDHTLRVRDLCMKIWEIERADLEVLEIAALLHDIWRPKEFETKWKICHAEYWAALAKDFLENQWLEQEKINKILDNLNENDKYIVLDKFLPYEETILNNPKANNILYVAYPSSRGGYAIKVVPKSIDDKTARKLFPEEWAGLENEELESVSGIKDILFCHIGRFIVSCNTLESVYNILNKVSIDC